jgi:hypothetical protein
MATEGFVLLPMLLVDNFYHEQATANKAVDITASLKQPSAVAYAITKSLSDTRCL